MQESRVTVEEVREAQEYLKTGITQSEEKNFIEASEAFKKSASVHPFDEKHIDRIFKPFERLHGRSTYEETGIGLTICNKIVTRHGGEIFVKRHTEHGVTFHITLPEKQHGKII